MDVTLYQCVMVLGKVGCWKLSELADKYSLSLLNADMDDIKQASYGLHVQLLQHRKCNDDWNNK
jgi:hypothetical protein